MPFAPTAGAGVAGPRLAERAAGWSQRWRVPITVAVGALIAVAAYLAWQSQRSPEQPAGTVTAGRNDQMVAAVAGLKRNPDANPPSSPPVFSATDSGNPFSATAGPDPTDGTGGTATTRAPTRTTRTGGTAATTGTSTGTGGGQTGTTVAGTSSTVANKLIYIGDQVTFDDYAGPGAGGITVTLQNDANRDGKGESTKATTVSSPSGGTYNFNVEPGCYVVVFSVPAGQTVLKGSASTALCLAAGESNARVDLVISRPVKPPASCTVSVGNRNQAGVQVAPDSANAFAPSYAWYDSAGKLIRSTTSLGPSDFSTPFPRTIGWSVRRYNFDPGPVVSVAAEDGKGGVSPRVTCTRRTV